MLKGEHVHNEIDTIDSVAKEFAKNGKVFESSMLKGVTLLLKLVLNIRQNQVKIMKNEGIELSEPRLNVKEKD